MAWKTMIVTMGLTLLCLVFVQTPGAAENEPATQAPYFEVLGADDSQAALDRFPLKATRAAVAINGVIARVTVRQTYANQGQTALNARYVFPAGTRAAVHGLTITIGEARVIAHIEERQKARRKFETAKKKGKSAGLLTQQRPNVMQMEVANILPGDQVEVELVYSERLTLEESIYEFVFPTVVGPRYSRGGSEAGSPPATHWIPSPYHASGAPLQSTFDLALRLAGGVPLEAVSSPSHEIETQWVDPATARILLAKGPGAGKQGERDFILRYRLTGQAIADGLMLHQGPEENFFMLMVQPPTQVATDSIPAREYIFVVDVSGSMHGFPLKVAKTLLEKLLAGLNSRDRFNVVLFAGDSRVLAPRSLPADEISLQKARDLIDRQQGGGGTELLAALKKSLALPAAENVSRSVVLISDGYISAEREVFDYIRDHLDQANIFSFGIGSSVNRYLIEGVARAGRGEPFIATKHGEAFQVAQSFLKYISQPVLTGIQVDFDEFEAYAVSPARIPDLTAARPLVVMGKWRGAPQGAIHIRGTNGSGVFERTLRVGDYSPRPDHSALPTLWARERLMELSDYAPRREHAGNRDNIVQLGLKYNLLTAYTSFVAVLETPRPLQGAARDVDQPLPLPLGVSRLAVGGPLVAGTEPDLLLMGVVLSLLAGLSWVITRRRMGSGM